MKNFKSIVVAHRADLSGCVLVMAIGILSSILGIPDASKFWGMLLAAFALMVAITVIMEARSLRKAKLQPAKTKNILDLPRNTRIR